jgi:hypothetical protein
MRAPQSALRLQGDYVTFRITWNIGFRGELFVRPPDSTKPNNDRPFGRRYVVLRTLPRQPVVRICIDVITSTCVFSQVPVLVNPRTRREAHLRKVASPMHAVVGLYRLETAELEARSTAASCQPPSLTPVRTIAHEDHGRCQGGLFL